MLACSLEMTARRLKNRGRHITPFANATAAEIATEYRHAIYSPEATNENIYFDLPRREFINVIKSRQLQWAPDGDEAFDDGSYILQFDVNDDIRLIGFKAPKDPDDFSYDRETL